MKPLDHAHASVRRHGGDVDDYLHVHKFLDSSKMAHPTIRHRAIFHHSLGCFIAERRFPDERRFSVRQIAEEHILEDCEGKIPTVKDWGSCIGMKAWIKMPDLSLDGEVAQLMLEPFAAWHDPRAAYVWFHGFGAQTIGELFGPRARVDALEIIKSTFGKVPSIDDWVANITPQRWMRP